MMYGICEAMSYMRGRDWWDWDIRGFVNIFTALKADLTGESNKFCCRVREVAKAANSLVIRFYMERKKGKLPDAI
jgi:hypothetical protein